MRYWLPGVFTALLLAASVAAQPQKAMELVPDDSLGFLMVKNLQGLSDDVALTAKRLKAPTHVSLLEILQKGMGLRDGLNQDGTILFIVLKSSGDAFPAEPVVALPVDDYQKVLRHLKGGEPDADGISTAKVRLELGLIAGVSDEEQKDPEGGWVQQVDVLVARQGGFAVMAPAGMRSSLLKVMKSPKSITARLAEAQGWLTAQDVSGVCTSRGIEVGLGMFVGGGVGAASTTKGQYEATEKTFKDIKQNVDFVTFGAEITDQSDWRLLTRAYFRSGGDYARWVSKAAPLEGDLLGRLPGGPYFLAGAIRIVEQMGLENVKDLFPKEVPEQKAEELTKGLTDLLRQVGEVAAAVYPVPKGEKGASGLPPAEPDAQMAFLLSVQDADAFVGRTAELFRRSYEAVEGIKGSPLKKVTFEQDQVGGRPAHLITVTIADETYDKPAPRQEGAAVPQQETTDREKYVLVLTSTDQRTVLLGWLPETGEASDLLRRVEKAKGRGIGGDAMVGKTRKLLPQRLLGALYVNPKEFAAAMPGSGEFPDAPPLAFALSTFDSGTEAQFLAPFDTIHAFFQAERSLNRPDQKPQPEKTR